MNTSNITLSNIRPIKELYTVLYNSMDSKLVGKFGICFELDVILRESLINSSEYVFLSGHLRGQKPTEDLYPEFFNHYLFKKSPFVGYWWPPRRPYSSHEVVKEAWEQRKLFIKHLSEIEWNQMQEQLKINQ